MTEKLGEQLKEYIERCEQISSEITQNIADIEFEKNGGEIHCCVDFSEIFSLRKTIARACTLAKAL